MSQAPVTQTVFGERGNCWSACLATILGLPLESIPSPMDAGHDESAWWNATRKWLKEQGYALLLTNDVSAGWRCDAPYIAGGPSPRGIEHATVYRLGKLVHDPHPDRSGLANVTNLAFLIPRAYTHALTDEQIDAITLRHPMIDLKWGNAELDLPALRALVREAVATARGVQDGSPQQSRNNNGDTK